MVGAVVLIVVIAISIICIVILATKLRRLLSTNRRLNRRKARIAADNKNDTSLSPAKTKSSRRMDVPPAFPPLPAEACLISPTYAPSAIVRVEIPPHIAESVPRDVVDAFLSRQATLTALAPRPDVVVDVFA